MQRNKLVIALAVISFLILGGVTLWNYKAPSDKVFGLDNFYAPESMDNIDPKALYEGYNQQNIFSRKSCKNTMTILTDPIRVDGTTKYWISSNTEKYSHLCDNVVSSIGEIKWEIDETSGDTWLLPYEDGDYIIAPMTITFINNNSQTLDGFEYLDFYVGYSKEFRIEVRNITAWWCHIGKDSNRHTTKYGADGAYSSANPGSILGLANCETQVRIWKLGSDGAYVRASIDELYGLSQ